MKTACWVVAFFLTSAGALILADRIAGSYWALPFAISVIAAAFSVDRIVGNR